ncbi:MULTISPECIES: pyridoxamine 5'-phosphate oxidase family protein [Micrococcaceae]|uniref:pyridoxine/pyridoxamine 5'-phosphate oxidase n=1 Tax=Micrococcaceae TaxID=1268 RepID=UPI0010368B48|nr:MULTISPECIES: pyridoxamine 5'-phosphate oxidase family protein [Micrococcaceae]TAP25100.1 pyridoxamine 5'-phosphate oxidase [Arthrobacter sp. S41]UXN32082.1 pyridoxamine 5'-phosphate oxidase family protein [Glutamicibacter sp. M10]
MTELRERLAKLPSFPKELSTLDSETVPENPNSLFESWLNSAIEAGNRQPHAMTFVTNRADGTPVGRTLIIKDFDENGYQFSTHRSSRKGQELQENPRASLVFFWRESGRQVRVTGTASALSDEASQLDWSGRPSYDGQPNPDWQHYTLVPDEFEFMQAREDRNHTRVEYNRDNVGQWAHHLVATPAG